MPLVSAESVAGGICFDACDGAGGSCKMNVDDKIMMMFKIEKENLVGEKEIKNIFVVHFHLPKAQPFSMNRTQLQRHSSGGVFVLISL